MPHLPQHRDGVPSSSSKHLRAHQALALQMGSATPQLHGTKEEVALCCIQNIPNIVCVQRRVEWDVGADSCCLEGQSSSDQPTELRSERQLPHTCVDTALLTLTQSLFLFHSLSQEETLQQLFFSLLPEDKKATPNCFQASVLWIL